MKIDQKKLKKQEEFVRRWKQNNYIGTWEMPTGGGKTYGAVLCLKELEKNTKKLIIVPSVYLKEQWEKELHKFDISNYEVVVINTAIKNKYLTDVLILDEIHRYAAIEFSNILDVVKYNTNKKVIGLTATLERKDNRHFILENYSPLIYKVSIKEALKEGLIPEFIVYNLPVKLTNEEQLEYKKLDSSFNKFFSFFDFNFNEAMKCLTDPYRRQVYSQSTGYPEKEVHINAINFAKTMRKRKEILYNSPNKDSAVAVICEKFKDKKIITFSEKIETVKKLKSLVNNSGMYHSKQAVNVKQSVIENYIRSSFTVLHTAKSLDEGMDIPDIDIAIIHSSTSSKRQTIQRIGRVLRKDGDKIPIIINLYADDIHGKPTQDKKWLINRIKGMPNVYWINSIEDINYDTEGKFKEEDRQNLLSEGIRF